MALAKRRLGDRGPEVGCVGLGCMSFAGSYGDTTEAESHATLDRAIELGVDFLDTSVAYGPEISENVIGSYLRKRPHAFVIATKAGIRRKAGTTERIIDNDPQHLRQSLEGSLRRLGRDHVDIFYLHRLEPGRVIEEVMEGLAALVKEGKTRGIGLSEVAPSTIRRAHAVHPVMAVQSEYSLWSRMPELGVIQACAELGIGFVPFSPLARGFLSGVQPHPSTFGERDWRRRNPRFEEPNYTHNIRALESFKALAKARATTPTALAMAWVLANGEGFVPIPGTRTARHLEECVAGAHLPLSAADLAEIDRVMPPGWAHGDRYSDAQAYSSERYC